jgi:hypothetical protein
VAENRAGYFVVAAILVSACVAAVEVVDPPGSTSKCCEKLRFAIP